MDSNIVLQWLGVVVPVLISCGGMVVALLKQQNKRNARNIQAETQIRDIIKRQDELAELLKALPCKEHADRIVECRIQLARFDERTKTEKQTGAPAAPTASQNA